MKNINASKRFSLGAFTILNMFFMCLVIFATLYPFYYCLVLSFNDGADAVRGGIYFWPRKISLDNYRFVFNNSQLLIAGRNTIARTLTGTLLHLLVTSIGAYALSKRYLACRRIYMVIFIITMYFSGGMIPSYIIVKYLGLTDNFLIYLIPTAWSYFHALLLMAYYDTIPSSLEESAVIDGANAYTIFFKIIFPVSMPIMATIALFCGVSQWNSWYDTMVYTSDANLETLQNLLMRMVREVENIIKANQMAAEKGGTAYFEVSPLTVRVTTMVVTTFPIVIAYPFLQKYFIHGIMLGAVKE